MQDGVVSYAEAAAIVSEHAAELTGVARAAEQVPLLSALGRVLAEPVFADRDQPPFPRSTRDGFAVRVEDAGESLRVVGLLRAGESWTGTMGAGEAIEIMTGAPAPAGADAVVMVEHVLREGENIRLVEGRTIDPGENIVSAGAEARAGAVVIEAETRVTPAQIAVAASCGAAQLVVWARPRVAVLATGDELVAIEQAPLAYQIRNSNTHSLAAQVLGAGGEPLALPPAPDELAALERAVSEALASADLLLLSGGVSMGKFDYVEQVLLSMGAEFFFTGAKIQPGKPVVFGRVGGKYFFGLPGNPVSTMVTFLLFVAPLLRAMGGEHAAPRFVLARLGAAVEAKQRLTRFLPARLHFDISASTVEPIAWQGSGDLAATARADCFLVVPGDSTGVLEAGALVTVLLAG